MEYADLIGGKIKPSFKPKGRGNKNQGEDGWRKSYMTLMSKFDVLAKKVEKSKKNKKRKRDDDSSDEE